MQRSTRPTRIWMRYGSAGHLDDRESIEILKDGETVFPKLTDAIEPGQSVDSFHQHEFLARRRTSSPNFHAKTDPTHPFDPLNPTIGTPVVGERFHEVLKTKAGQPLLPTNVLVQDIPFVDQIPVISYLLKSIFGLNPDTADEVEGVLSGQSGRGSLVLRSLHFPTFLRSCTARRW